MDYNTALGIAYPLRVSRDTTQEYLEEIARRTTTLIDSGDLDIIKNEMSALENQQFSINFFTLINCFMEPSKEAARRELNKLVTEAASRVAIYQFKKEMDAAAEAIAVENYYRRMEERCSA